MKFEHIIYLRVADCGQSLCVPRNVEINKTIIAKSCQLKMNGKEIFSRTPLKATLLFEYASSSYKGDRPKITKPDIDNCVKLVLDAMNEIVYDDKSRITAIAASKKWGEEDKIYISVEGID